MTSGSRTTSQVGSALWSTPGESGQASVVNSRADIVGPTSSAARTALPAEGSHGEGAADEGTFWR